MRSVTSLPLRQALERLGLSPSLAPEQAKGELLKLKGLGPSADIERALELVEKHVPASTAASTDDARALAQRANDRGLWKEPRQLDPVVQTLLDKCDVKGPVSRTAERVLRRLAVVDGLIGLNPRDPKQLEELVSSTSRRELFRAQAILSLYRPLGLQMRLANEAVSRLQFAIGEVQMAQDMLREAQAHAPAVKGYVAGWLGRTVTALEEIVKYEWNAEGPKSLLRDLVQQIAQAPLPDGKEDSQWLKGRFREHLEKVANTSYPADSINDGVHELRRQLRWVARFADSVGDIIRLVPNQGSTPEFQKLASEPVSDKTRARELAGFTTPREDAIPIPFGDYLGLIKAIGDLGGLKDDAERDEFFATAYRAVGEPVPAQFLTSEEGFAAEAQKRFDALRDSQLLPVLRRHFSEGSPQ